MDLGIPFALNHQDTVAAQTPLNIPALWWNWQYGYKFARIDLATDAPAPNNQFFIHLGSTGCDEAMALRAETEATTEEPVQATTMTETMPAEEAEDEVGNVHGGMGATPPTTACNNPNVVTITFSDFDPTQNIIVADLATLLENVNIKQPVASSYKLSLLAIVPMNPYGHDYSQCTCHSVLVVG